MAIERILARNSGRAVYVSPTKALVHQIFVEISNGFPTSGSARK
jgi:superfamily II RNA helicase